MTMSNVDRDEKNVKKCPSCGDTMAINRDGDPVCICQAREADNGQTAESS